ncbi:hypothetical protein [Kribbella sp. CA-247076]|uniref:hypothetical protein n=1 Tax=Kribbella sp. CA-247076 TaxID=3239941 RepID=UPI003D924EB1
MTTKITVIFDNPDSPDAFERAYPDLLERARKIPGVLRIETAKVWPKEDGSPTPAYRLIDFYLPDYATASAAVATPEAGEFFPRAFELATGGARAVFAELEES